MMRKLMLRRKRLCARYDNELDPQTKLSMEVELRNIEETIAEGKRIGKMLLEKHLKRSDCDEGKESS